MHAMRSWRREWHIRSEAYGSVRTPTPDVAGEDGFTLATVDPG
jgi:hypothetical protein